MNELIEEVTQAIETKSKKEGKTSENENHLGTASEILQNLENRLLRSSKGCHLTASTVRCQQTSWTHSGRLLQRPHYNSIGSVASFKGFTSSSCHVQVLDQRVKVATKAA